MLCDYGCGQIALYQFKNGKWCCSKAFNQCPNMKPKAWNKGKKLSKDHINELKKSHIGQVAWNRNIPCNEETKKKISDSLKGRSGWSKGKKFSKTHKKKMSNAKKGKTPWNKGKVGLQKSPYKGITGRYSEETLQKMSKSSVMNEEQKKNLKIINRRTIKEWSLKYPFFAIEEEMQYNPDKPGEREIQVHCKNHKCENSKEKGGWFTPTYSQFSGRICAIEKDDGNSATYFYCCDSCKNECPLFNIRSDPYKNNELPYTSSEYQTFRQEVLNRANNLCEYCNQSAEHVHHSRPQKLEPGLALDPDYGIACCQECHYKYGHETGTECSTGSLANKVCI